MLFVGTRKYHEINTRAREEATPRVRSRKYHKYDWQLASYLDSRDSMNKTPMMKRHLSAPALLRRGNSCNLIHSIYRCNAQLKETRLDSIKLSRLEEKRLYAPSCQFAGVTQEEKKEEEEKGGRGKGRNSPAMYADARALYAGWSR